MNNIYLLYAFNNYFNRQFKRYDELSQYIEDVSEHKEIDNVINFNPGDGIDAKWLCNLNTTSASLESDMPDYMLVVDDDDEIQQRWFVIDGNRTRSGQYELSLHRDTVAEEWTNLRSSPIFVEKGILNKNDPMIFNSENMTYNQIKNSETLLEDSTKCPWIVGYFVNDVDIGDEQDQTVNESITPDIVVSDITQWEYAQYRRGYTGFTKFKGAYPEQKYTIRATKVWSAARYTQYVYTFNNSYCSVADAGALLDTSYRATSTFDEELYRRKLGLKQTEINAITSKIEETYNISDANLSTFIALDGKIIQDTTQGKFWKIKVDHSVDEFTVNLSSKYSVTYDEFSALISATNTDVGSGKGISETSTYSEGLSYGGKMDFYWLDMEEITSTLAYRISKSRRHISNQPFDMFCMPYGWTTIKNFNGTDTSKNWSAISMLIAKDIANRYGGDESTALFDLQLLPYCPVRQFFDNGYPKIDTTTLEENKDYNYIKQSNTPVGIIFWSQVSDASFTIEQAITVSEPKIDNETKMYRLCSPNGNGEFEFSAAKNGGVTRFGIDFTYKPYNPYIHVQPMFKNLYGGNFNDFRGLVCGGKFDLPQTSSAWASYERSNSNYLNIFNREIENLEVTQKYERMSDVVGGISSTVSGVMSGLKANSGELAALGGSFGMVAGAADYAINENLRRETMDYKKDMFGYEMGNIKARPDSITSLGSLVNNNKYFPYIEYYTCTATETEALKNKISYNGMSVGRIGTISEFLGYNTLANWPYGDSQGWMYFKGQLIRLTGVTEDWHFINAIKEELDRGIYFRRGET